MSDINQLVSEIIPYPADYTHRNGFSNDHIIDNLDPEDRNQVEEALINLLLKHPSDTLIVETLGHMKSEKSISILSRLLMNSSCPTDKLVISSSIFEINHNIEMVDIALKEFEKLDDSKDAYYVYKVSGAFYYLAKFNNDKVESVIEKYTNHKEYLISYNAKRFISK